ncbi:MAG: heme-degrading domain-containing protein [Chloroflexi bacterium OHK40]
MEINRDLARIAEQERRLRFAHFDTQTAWELGTRLKAAAEARGVAVTIEIRLAGQTVFLYAMEGTAPVNADWARRKRNVAELYGQSSYAVGLALTRDGGSLEERLGLPTRDYAAHGGSFPLVLQGSGPVGTVTVSGLPQREDHALIVAVLATYLGIPISEVAFDDAQL